MRGQMYRRHLIFGLIARGAFIMASGLYTVAEKGFLDADIDLLVDTIKVRIVADEDYTFSAAETNMSTATKYASSTDVTLAAKSTTAGVFDDTGTPTFASLAIDAAKDIDGLVVFLFSTDDAGSTPILYIDLTTSLTPNGGDVTITWNASGIFSIAI